MVERERKHISAHIEKTAGSSLEDFLVHFYGRKNVYVFSADTERIFRADNLVMLLRFSTFVNKLRSTKLVGKASPLIHGSAIKILRMEGGREELKLPDRWSVIHGHFVADKFDNFLTDPFRTIIFREPLERTLSHYKYWKLAKGVVNQRVKIPYDPSITFRDYALLPDMQNYQSRALGSIPIEAFDVVGVTENFSRFISEFLAKRGDRFRGKLFQTPHLNKSASPLGLKDLGVDSVFVKIFKSLNEQDYGYYQKVIEMNGLDTP